jgi:hypothetical protein
MCEVLTVFGERHNHCAAMINPHTGFSAHDIAPLVCTVAKGAILFF